MALALKFRASGGVFMLSKYLLLQFFVGIVVGFLIACSPTKFGKNQDMNNICDSSVVNCVVENESTMITQSFKVGAGKVDILFINDNSASMSKNQINMANRFSGFIHNLDKKNIDYRIAIATTDFSLNSADYLISFKNGQKFITMTEGNRVDLFNQSIVRNETVSCEDLIIAMFNTYGILFQSNSFYKEQYKIKCPSSDTRGIYVGNIIISENNHEFMRSDANLNIILISNDNVRQGKEMEDRDKASTFIEMMRNKIPNKNWSFNSIVVKDEACKQMQTLHNAKHQIVMNQQGAAILGGIGIEYINLSNSVTTDIDNNPRPRGQVLDICQNDYTQNFTSISTQISEDARIFTMRCTPSESPTIFVSEEKDSSVTIPHTWSGNRIIFEKGSEGLDVIINYKCYTGPT